MQDLNIRSIFCLAGTLVLIMSLLCKFFTHSLESEKWRGKTCTIWGIIRSTNSVGWPNVSLKLSHNENPLEFIYYIMSEDEFRDSGLRVGDTLEL